MEDGGITPAYSPAIQRELDGVLAVKFRWPADMIELACAPYWKIGVCLKPRLSVQACSDPDDDRILECAVEARAQFIITGDKHLLTMKSFEGILILTADQYLKL